MVVVVKQDGSPIRTVEMQRLNDAYLRRHQRIMSPYQKTMIVQRRSI